jgi:N-acetylmuramoyl-L-alanine amidase
LLAWQRQQSGREYKVAGGDTLSEIAQRFNVSVRSLKARNGLASNTIRIGQTLVIPDA